MADRIEEEERDEGSGSSRLGSTLTRRTLLGGAALAIGGAALAACSTGGNAQSPAASTSSESLLNKVKSRGQLNVTTSLLYPPEFYKDKTTGQPAGYDIELLKMLAKDLSVSLNIIDVPDNAQNIANVQSGKADLVSAGLVNTPARALVLNFTRGYVPYTQVVVIPVGGATSIAQLNQSGKKITALTASTAFFRAQLLFPKAQVIPLAQDEALLSVATGKADGCLIEIYLATPFIAQHSNTTLMNNGQAVATEFGCWGIPAGDYLWWRYLDNWIAYNTDNSQIPGMYKNIIGLDWVQPS